MEHYVEKHPQWGQMLWLKGCGAQMGIPLEYGIRILHASCEGMENLLYEQPTVLLRRKAGSSGADTGCGPLPKAPSPPSRTTIP